MDAVEIFLLGGVGLSVLVFLILDNLDPLREGGEASKQSGDVYNSDSKIKARIEESVRESGCHQSVGGDGDAETRETFERECFEEREERDNLGEKSDLGGGKNEDNNICGERGISDDWEGVERSELEKIFGEAMVFVDCKSNGDRIIGEDVKVQLYGLQKVALEGPCRGSQPMALHVSARSKWNAWQKLGNMSAEMAMENYIAILSEAVPDWNVNQNLPSKGEDTMTAVDLPPTPQENIQGDEAER